MKALQIISDEALEQGRKMSPEEILRFLEDFRLAYGARSEPFSSSQTVASSCTLPPVTTDSH
ncbi:MAG: hypothetical protein WD406_08090 [Pseudohongiellaceae bacterium]